MLSFFEAIESSGFAYAARSSPWLYPAANLAHVLGAALLAGSILVFDILVLRRRYELAGAVSGTALGIAATGLVLVVLGAIVLFSAEATALIGNPVFLVKMILVAVALANIAIYHSSPRNANGLPDRAPIHAAVSASLWIAIVIAGRSIAYV